MKGEERPKRNVIAVLAVNLTLAIALLSVCLFYVFQYTANTRMQNVSDIQNINRSSGHIFDVVLNNRRSQLEYLADYCEEKQMTADELLTFAAELYSDDEASFQLIGPDFTGFCADLRGSGERSAVDYSVSNYESFQETFEAVDAKTDKKVYISPEFTDNHSAMRSLAFFRRFIISESPYTLMVVLPLERLRSSIDIGSQYDKLSTVLINAGGDYIIGSNGFRTTNLFRYLYTYGYLPESRCEEIRREMAEKSEGYFFAKNYVGDECVYAYSHIVSDDRYTVTCVPTASFISQNIDYSIALIVTIFLGAILVYNLMWMKKMLKRLRIGVEREKNANKAKTEFLSRMSHDMRTPLNSVLNFAGFIEKTDALEKAKEYSRKINTSGRYLLTLINDTLGMSRIESGNLSIKPELVKFSDFESGLLSILGDKAEKKQIDFTIERSSDEDLSLMLDPLRLQQIFVNLLNNAIKFTPPGGKVSLFVEDEGRDGNMKKLKFVVSDTGIGMSRDFLENKLFKPFSQEHRGKDNEETGTGLGLSIAKNLIEYMGGTIECKSEPGVGTTFTIRISAEIGNDLAESAQSNIETDTTQLKGCRLLMCEDNLYNREVAKIMLDEIECTFDEAENGQIGVEKFENSEIGYYDAILMDIRMPIMDGMEATRKIRALPRADAKTVPIIAMSADAFDEDVSESMACGMSAYLPKPIEQEEFYKTLCKQLTPSPE